MDAVSFLAWVDTAQPGDRIEYHRGCIASDRAIDTKLDALANLIYAEANATWWRMSPCQHARGLLRGSKRIRLTQERLGEDMSRYIAIRTHVAVRPIAPCKAEVERLAAEVEYLRRLVRARTRPRARSVPSMAMLPGLEAEDSTPMQIGLVAFSWLPVSRHSLARLAA